jgi:hypothetical protein
MRPGKLREQDLSIPVKARRGSQSLDLSYLGDLQEDHLSLVVQDQPRQHSEIPSFFFFFFLSKGLTM